MKEVKEIREKVENKIKGKFSSRNAFRFALNFKAKNIFIFGFT